MGQPYEISDHLYRQLRLVVQPTGARAFAMRTRIAELKTCGLDLKKAREATRDLLETIANGGDPRADRTEDNERSIAELAAKFIEKRIKPKARRWRDVEAMLERDIVRKWRNRQIASITARDCLDLIEEIDARGSPVVANRNVRLLRQLFAWAVKGKYLVASPAIDLEKPYEERPRQRALSPDEIRLVLASFHCHGLSVRDGRQVVAAAGPTGRGGRHGAIAA